MTTLPKVTIVTPSLNQGRFIERTIRSVVDQDYPNLEYIVVDGGSTDSTLEVIRRHEGQIDHWVSEPDSGQVDAIRKGFAVASGELVAYINSDDYYLPGAIRALVEPFVNDPHLEWSAGACRYVTGEGQLETVLAPVPPPAAKRRMVDEAWYVPQASSLWRRDLFDRVGPLRDDLHYVFDSEFGLRAVLAGALPTFVDREIAVRFLHGEAKSASPELFASEWQIVRTELMSTLGSRDLVKDLAYRVVRRIRRAAQGR